MEAFKQILTDLIKSKTPVICNYGEEARMNGINEHYTPFFPVIITSFKEVSSEQIDVHVTRWAPSELYFELDTKDFDCAGYDFAYDRNHESNSFWVSYKKGKPNNELLLPITGNYVYERARC